MAQFVQVLAEDPDLGEGLDDLRLREAQRVILARVVRVPRGPWRAGAGLQELPGGFGLLVLGGLLSRRVGHGGRFGAELLGPGDLLRPWDDPFESATVPFTSCATIRTNAFNAPIGGTFENGKLGVRVRSRFSPSTSETTKVILKFDDDLALNLSGIPACPASELVNKNLKQAWEQCGPGADGTPASEGNAYLSTALGQNVSGIGSTIPTSGGAVACTMIFKGADNAHVTIYARAPANTSGCNNPATNTGGTTTVLFTGTLTHQPASSAYNWTLTVPNTQTADPALDDFYATVARGGVFRGRCTNTTPKPHRMLATWDYTAASDPNDNRVATHLCPH